MIWPGVIYLAGDSWLTGVHEPQEFSVLYSSKSQLLHLLFMGWGVLMRRLLLLLFDLILRIVSVTLI